MTQLIRFLGVQNPSWSERKNVPSGLRQTPLGARKPVARISVAHAVLADLQERAVVRHDRGQAVAGRLGVVEVPLGVGLEPHRELVEMLGDLVVAVEVFVKVDLAIAVEIAEADDLVAAADVNPARDDLEPQRLEQTRGDPPPGEPLRRRIDPAGQPDIAVPGADRRMVAVGHEVEPREPHLAKPGVVVGDGQNVDGQRSVVPADDGPGLEDLRPPRRTAVSQRLERHARGRGLRVCLEIVGCAARTSVP